MSEAARIAEHKVVINPGQVGQVLGNGGAAGDYLESLLIKVTTGSGALTKIRDGAGSDITILPASPGSFSDWPIWLGITSRNGPWRVTVGTGATVTAIGNFSRKNTAEYGSFPGTTGNYASTPDVAANSVTGDLEICVRVTATDYTPTANTTLFAKWNPTGNQRSWALDIETTGKLILRTSPDGTTVRTHTSSVATGLTDGTPKWLKATRTIADGTVKFWTSDDNVTYAQLGANVAGSIESIFDSTAPVEVGTSSVGTADFYAGRVYFAELRNGLAGTVVAKFDAREGVAGATTFTAGTGEVWTMNGTAALV